MESVRAFVRLVAAATELRTALSASVGDGGALMAAVACAAIRSAGVVKFTAHTDEDHQVGILPSSALDILHQNCNSASEA